MNNWRKEAKYISSICEKYGFPAPKLGDHDWHISVVALIDFLDRKATVNPINTPQG